MPFHGIVIIDKPAGITSHDVVNRVRRILKTKRVGHTGTLDPEATGVLVLCIGNGLRVAEYLSAARKSYVAEITFGIETDTQDIWGEVTAEHDASEFKEADLTGALACFRGTIYQTPPMVSARRFEGKHLYELARKGVTVEREPRAVEVIDLKLTRFVPGAVPIAGLEVTCTTGTYIRTLAYDIGSALGVGAAMSALRRTSVGCGNSAFTLENAHTLDELSELAERDPDRLADAMLPPEYALRDWPQARVGADLEMRIRNGQTLTQVEAGIADRLQTDTLVAVLSEEGELIAVAKITDDGVLQPVKVMRLDEADHPRY